MVGAEPYHFGAAGSLLPEDLALAWGPILAPPYAGKISYSQYSRFYFWRTRDGALDRGTIVSHSANTHIIPATARLEHGVACVSTGDDVRLEGWLVDVEGIDDPSLPLGHQHDARRTRGRTPARRSTSTRLTINEGCTSRARSRPVHSACSAREKGDASASPVLSRSRGRIDEWMHCDALLRLDRDLRDALVHLSDQRPREILLPGRARRAVDGAGGGWGCRR